MTSTDHAPVVVAVADEHEAGLRYAVTIAVRDHRPLRIVHVAPPAHGLAGPESVLVTFSGVELVAEQILDQQHERALQLVGGTVPVRKALLRGAVADMLVEDCADAHLLVVQHRSAGRLGRLLTGSTAARLAARSPVPMVSVPELWAGPRRWPHVTVAVGDRDVAGRDSALLGWAFAEAESRGASVTVLHACYIPTLGGEVYVDQWMLEDWQRAARSDLEQQLGSWSAAHPTVAVGVDVPCLRPADALIRASAGSDLLVVRRRSQGPAHLGSVVGAAVRESLCPLLVVTPQSRPPETRAGQGRDRRLARRTGGL